MSNIINAFRDAVAGRIADRGNTILEERFPEDMRRGVIVLEELLEELAPQHPDIQRDILERIVFRPPRLMLARDNTLRMGADGLAKALRRIRASGVLLGAGRHDLLEEVDVALRAAGLDPEAMR